MSKKYVLPGSDISILSKAPYHTNCASILPEGPILGGGQSEGLAPDPTQAAFPW